MLKNELSNLIQEREKDKDKKIRNDIWRLNYHLMPPVGWLSDPNGLCELNGTYHVFYQYSPFTEEGGMKFWGHYSSKDFMTWKKEKTALYPDTENDKDGVYSGSAYVENGKAYIYYTGNVKYPGNHDYIYEGRGHNTIMVTTENGETFSEKKVLLTNSDYPENMSCHVRDPRVWKNGDHYCMILGARTKADVGEALLYISKDKINWTFCKAIKSGENLGYMWECPDVFELNGKQVLLLCPQNVEKNGISTRNISRNGYFIVEGNITSNKYKLENFRELDHGFDFYAPQTFSDKTGRRILIGWMGMPDEDYKNPTVSMGWQHALTIPRELKIKNNRILQSPLKELEKLRTNHRTMEVNDKLYVGNSFEAIFTFKNEVEKLSMKLRNDVCLNYNKGQRLFELRLGKSGYGRKKRTAALDSLHQIRIFSDTSSIEIFLNNGEETFSTRIYDDAFRSEIIVEGVGTDGIVDIYDMSELTYA